MAGFQPRTNDVDAIWVEAGDTEYVRGADLHEF